MLFDRTNKCLQVASGLQISLKMEERIMVASMVDYIRYELKGLYPEPEIKSFIRMVLEKVSGLTPADILTYPQRCLSEHHCNAIRLIVDRLKLREPIQYVLGQTFFYGIPIQVDNRVLIPRPETAELVDLVLKENEGSQGNILDIGTGSGCIAIALAVNLPLSHVVAFDVSVEALNVAYDNADANNVLVRFYQYDILKERNWDNNFDVIVSNPPYIKESEQKSMEANVLDYEPSTALFVNDDDPLLFYRNIAEFAKLHLNNHGKLYFEINQEQGEQTKTLLKELGFDDVVLAKDLYGNDRMIRATYNKAV